MKPKILLFITRAFFTSRAFRVLVYFIKNCFLSINAGNDSCTTVDISEICALAAIGMSVITVILCTDSNQGQTYIRRCPLFQTLDDMCVLSFTDINRPERSFRFVLGEGAVIGRKPEQCMIILDRDFFISERHCRVYRENDCIMIKNLCKYQRLTVRPVNGKDIKVNYDSVCELNDGDVIVLGFTSLKIKII